MADFQSLRDKLAALPVYSLIDPVTRDVSAGLVTVVAASTGSGKSMMLPGALADSSSHQIVVLAPRRFLAIDAAYNVAELASLTLGDEVGYALGQMDGESSQRSHVTKLLYCTYGYAISSGLINKAETIVLDEVHEADEQISLARAILRQRKTADKKLRILEMSATVDAPAQARYWHPIAETAVHIVEGQTLSCDILHESPMQSGNKDRTAEQIILDLLTTQNRKGIVLFRPGVREVETSVAELKKLLAGQGITDTETVAIHGGTPADERRAARAAPTPGKRKIIVGTNVIESGVNLRWLDAGVSDGYRKIPYHRDDTGADALVLEDLPQSGLLQQIGRVNRDPAATGFERGLFILHAKKPFDLRRPQNGPAIQRQSLNGIAFHAASLGYNPTQLTWDATGPHAVALLPRFEQAKEELMRLHLLHDDWTLTKEGQFIKHLPVSPEIGALLVEAKKVDDHRLRQPQKPPRVMRDAVIIAAIAESHGLRQDPKTGHKGDQHRTSDFLDAMNAFRTIRKEPLAQNILDATENFLASASEDQLTLVRRQRLDLEAICAKHNVSLTGFVEVARLSDEIASRLGQRDNGIRVDTRDGSDKYDAERYGELQRCLLNAHVNRLFFAEHDALRDLLRDYGKQRNDAGQPFNGYILSRESIVPQPKPASFLVGSLREIQSEKKTGQPPLVVLTSVTVIPLEIFVGWAVARATAHQPVLSEIETDSGIFTARYAGKANFELPFTSSLRLFMGSSLTE